MTEFVGTKKVYKPEDSVDNIQVLGMARRSDAWLPIHSKEDSADGKAYKYKITSISSSFQAVSMSPSDSKELLDVYDFFGFLGGVF